MHLCAGSYTVTAVKFGIEITVSGPDFGSYNISVTASSGDTLSHVHNENKSVVPILNLKPCTEYTATVSFINNGSTTDCESTNKTVSTGKMGKCER